MVESMDQELKEELEKFFNNVLQTLEGNKRQYPKMNTQDTIDIFRYILDNYFKG